ncbi:T5SS/PEP-CTERM-associated repeat protein/autotransporter-associated beta strand protein/predicted outer membrane repeat protein, partial [Ereboglobus sp. PH5-5]|uniref:beta strand repeat-containing protein n=1 Tax=Ereboglobus sp. PH5-5 TaxID=2940529 RepID=UPI002405D902
MWQKTGNGTWADAANWSNGVPNAAGATAIISNDFSSGNHTITIANPGVTVGTLSIEGTDAAGSTITVQTSTLSFAATGGLSAILGYQGSNYVTISSVVNLLSDLSIQAGTDPLLPTFASKLTISGRIDGNGHAININAGHAPATTTISGAITGAGTRLIKTGGGALVLSNANNTFSGGLDISAGTVRTTIANNVGAGTILGGGVAASGANYLGLGDIRIANTGVSLTINTAGDRANQHVTLAGGLITLDKGGSLIITENDYRKAFRFVLNSGTISGGSDAGARGVLALNGADFVYNADGSGGSAFIDAPTLVLNTGQNTTAMSVTLNDTVMQSGLGLARKTGTNALTFTAGDTGTFVADEFVIESARGVIALNQTAFDLANGLTFAGANGIFTNQLATATGGQVSLGLADQLGSSSLNIGAGVITNVLLNGHDQNFSSINLGDAARLGLWFDSATPSTLGINSLVFAGSGGANPFAENFLSVYNWTGNPASHLGDGAVASSGHTVVAAGGVDLSKIWFRGYAPGAVDLGGGVLAPVDFLTTTLTGGGNWFDFARWTLDIPDRAGTTVIAPQFGTEASVNLQGRAVTLGHLETSHLGSSHSRTLTFTSGTVIFDSGLMVGGTKMASTISGTGGVRIASAIVLENDLVVTATGVVYANGDVLYGAALGGALSGTGNIIAEGHLVLYGGSGYAPTYTGTIHAYKRMMLGAYNHTTTGQLFYWGGALVMHEGSSLGLGYHNNVGLNTRLIIDGDFSMTAVYLNYDGDVELTADRVISTSGNGQRHTFPDVGFGPDLNLTGVGALTLNAANTLVMNSGSNVFSGGFTKSGGGTVRADLHSDLVMGALDAGHNYYGSGSVTVAAGNLFVANNGYDSYLRGLVTTTGGNLMFIGDGSTVVSGTVLMGNGRSFTGTGGGAIEFTDTSVWQATGASGANLIFGGDLTVNTAFAGTGATQLYARPNPGAEIHITSTMSGGITNVGTFYKQSAGEAYLHTPVHLGALNIQAGNLIIGGHDYMLPRTGTVAPNLAMSGGLLTLAGGSAGSPNVTTLNSLTLTGNAGLFLNEHASLLFKGGLTWSGTGFQLSLTNDSGIWSTSGAPGDYDTYVYFTGTAGFSGANAWRLDRVSFTGYETGAELVQVSGSNLWFLAPTGAALNEWVGARGTGIDTDRLWSSAVNWVGGVPNAAGRTAVVRDADGLLNGNRILVDGAFTVGQLLLESSGGQVFTVGGANGGVLVFDNGADNAVLTNSGNHVLTLDADMRLDGGLDFRHTSPNTLYFNSRVSGSGGIVYSSNTLMFVGTTDASGTSASDFTGGFRIVGSTATTTGAAGLPVVRIAADGALFGSGSHNGIDAAGSIQSLTIGDGTPGRWYYVGLDTANSVRVVDASLRIAGNWNFGIGSNNTGVLTFRSADPGYVESGTWTLQGSYNSAVLNIEQDLQGLGGLRMSLYGMRVNFYGNNTFAGDVILGHYNGMSTGVGSDSALGQGVVRIVSAHNLVALNGARIISNEFEFNNAGASQFSGTFTLNHSGTSTFARDTNMTGSGIVIVSAGHVFSGTGALTIGGGHVAMAPHWRLEGAHEYTGNTRIDRLATLAVGNAQSIGSGTLFLMASSNPEYTTTLASWGGPVTLANTVVFSHYNIGLNGAAGALTLSQTSALPVTLVNNTNFTVTGSVVFGENLRLTGAYGINKTGAGVLTLNNNNNDYTGDTTITNGTLRVNAGGDIALGGATAAGEHYLGMGHVKFASGNVARMLELVVGGTAVDIYGNLALNGNSAAYTASINITDIAGAISGASIGTNLVVDTDSTVSGNAHGYLRTAGDVIKTGTATLHWTGGNIVTPNFVLREGALDLGNVNSTRTGLGSFTLGGAALNVSGSQTFAGTLFNLAGSGTINMNGASGSSLLTFADLGSWDGTLDIINWNGDSTYGGGLTQVRFANDVLTAFDHAKLATISFYSSGVITYAPGAKVLKNTQLYYELIPTGVSAIWNGNASLNNWSSVGNWETNVAPNGPGSVAVFSTTLQLNGTPVNIDVANLTLGGLTFMNNTGENYSLGGLAFTFEQMDPDEVANLTLQNNNSVTIANAGVALLNRLVVSTVGTGTLTISAPVIGAQGMIKSGAGELVLAGNTNDFSGGVTLLDGTLTAAASSLVSSGTLTFSPLGTGTLTVAGTLAPTLAFALNGAQTIDNAIDLATQLDGTDAVDVTLKLAAAAGNKTTLTSGITQSGSGAGSLEKTGAGELVLAAASAHTGTTTVSAGTLSFTAANAIASGTAVVVNAALFTGDIEQTLVNLSGTGHIIAGADGNNLTGHVIALNTESTTYSGSITGDGALTKTGTGALTLSGTNTHTGMTTVNGGALAITGWTGSASAIHIGNTAGTSGTVNVSGYFGSVGNLYAGNSGTGFMTITDSGTVQNAHGYIGNNASRLGVVTVTDSGVWQNTGNLYVGNSGTGFLSIEGNGTVQNTTAYIGYNTSSSGSVTVTGSGFWLNTANLHVGNSGKGFLTIEGSGSVQSSEANIGTSANSTGSVTVTGSGLWDNTSGLGRMHVYRGSLTISEKGAVKADTIHIGPSSGGQGSVTVSGSGSLVARFISLAYTSNGKGYLTITDNGFVSGEAYISDATGGYGSVLIEKSGHWQTNQTYYTGRSGTGILTITDSGSLTATSAFTAGNNSNSLGEVTVGGAGLLRATGALTLGNSGRGILTIEDNATVNTGWVKLAEYNAASGVLNLNGGLLRTGTLIKGSGTGTVYFNSGTLQATKGGASFISGFSGAKGSLVIQSGGAFIDSKAFNIGVAGNSGFSGVGALHKLGTGTLTLAGTGAYTGGTEVEAGSLVLATSSATTSSRTIGTGTLTVRSGAAAYVAPPSAVPNYTFDNDLAGAGLLDVNLYAATNTLTLTGDTGGFTGTANFRKATYTLSGGAFNAATLVSSTNSTIIAGTGSNHTGNFVFNGGNVNFDLSGTGSRAAGWIDTGTLQLNSGNVRVDLAQVTGSSAFPLLQQDEGAVRQLVNAQSLTGSVSNLKLNGGAISLSSVISSIRQSSAIAGNNGDVATGYYAVAMTSTGAAGTGTGLYLGSVLTRLDLRSGYTTILDGDTDGVAGGDEFHAQITGAGNLGIQATGTITLNAANTHTGTTTVFDGALRLGIDGALGKTSRLDIHSGAIADINGRAQTIGAFSGSAGSTLLVNGGTVTGSNASVWTIDGLVDATAAESVIQAAGAGMTANINSGTLLLANSSTLTLGAGALTIGSGNTGSAVLDIKDSLARNQHATIGGPGGNGRVMVSGTGLWLNTGNLALGSAGAGALAIGDSGSVAVGGIYSQGANSTLALDASARGLNEAFIIAGSATVGGTISVDGFGADSVFSTAGAVLASDQQVLIKTTGTISGTFASATLDGFDAADLPDYLYGGIYKTADAKQYLAGVNLSWLGGETDGHGNFTVASGTSFDMNISLADQNNSPYASGWDGRSLTVTASNSGTLVLSASNSFTGDIFIRNGALVAATGTNAGWALGSGANTVYYDGAAGSAARLVFATGGTMTQRQIISAGANATLEAASGADLTVTTAPLGSGGGAVYVNAGGTFGITGGVTFTGNRGSSVSANGAAIYNAGELSATGAIFASNTTAGYAGAIYNTGTMSLASGTLAGNHSAMHGGAVYSTGTISGSGLLFASNTSGSNGGAVSQEGATAALNLQSSVFDGNYASSGGAIWNGSLARVEIANSSTFSNNRAALNGGAVYTTGAFTGADLTFDGNVSGSHGGAIHNSGVISGTNLVFTSNTARAGSGGAIHNVSSMTVDITTGSFASNRAGGGGGAIYTAGTVELNGIVTFADNRAVAGGAVAVDAGGYFTNTGMVRFLDNRSTSTGGAISVGGTVNIDGALFARNYAAAAGGAIAATGGGAILVSNALFVSNSSNGTNGGAITLSNNSRAIVISSTFTNNRATKSSGAIAAFSGGRVSIDGSRFESNYAGTFGGVSENYLGTLTINNSVFVSNSAASNGGVIANCGTMGIVGSVFTGNYSGGGGGALSNYGAAYVNTLTDVIFTGNTAAGVGGAIYNQGLANTIIAVSSGSTLAYTGNTARGNTAAATDSAGGFLYAHSGSVIFDIAGALAIGDENSIAIRADGIASASGTIAFTKTGDGALTFWAYNTYTGTTFVNAGLLSLRGYLASAHTIVAANSTLGGTGTAAGNVTILSHGHLSPGASPGLLTILG